MKTTGKWMILLSIMFVLLYQDKSFQAADPLIWEEKTITNPNKSWTITFSHPLRIETVSHSSVYIVGQGNKKIPVDITIGKDQKSIKISPKSSYKMNQQYWLFIDESVRNENRDTLQEDIRMAFTVKTDGSSTTTNKNNTSTSTAKNNKEEDNLKVSIVHHPYFSTITVVTTQTLVTNVKIGNSKMQYTGNNTFELALTGVNKGDSLQIRTYDQGNKLVGREIYKVE